jgi:YidC/Oxa1 family membrane protein insertase
MLSVLSVAVGAAYHVVSTLVQLLTPVAGGLAPAAAIVLFTIAVRLLLLPLTFYAMRGQASQARVAAQAQALRERHSGQPDRQQRELAALYQREAGGMLTGCLPLLLQLPFFSVMYTLFRSATVAGHPNSLLGHDLLGAPLGSHWLTAPGPFSIQGAVFLGLFALLAGACWLASRAARRSAAPAPSLPPGPSAPPAPAGSHPGTSRSGASRPGTSRSGMSQPATSRSGTSKSGAPGSNLSQRVISRSDTPRSGSLSQSSSGQLTSGQPTGAVGLVTRVMPYATLAFAVVMPLAAGLYLLTTTAWAAVERTMLARRATSRRADRPVTADN